MFQRVIKRKIRFSFLDSAITAQAYKLKYIERITFSNAEQLFVSLFEALRGELESVGAARTVRMFANYFPCCIAVHEFLTFLRFPFG